MPADASTSHIRIILVPGTWAYGIFGNDIVASERLKSPRWFEAGSQFRQKLEAELRAAGAAFEIDVLSWSGANSVRERALTARRLTDMMLARSRDEQTRTVIVAHSHGGNIACKAANLLRSAALDLRIVTLATPFLQAQPRTEDSPKTILQIGQILLCVLCLYAFAIAKVPAATQSPILWRELGLGVLLIVPIVAVSLWYNLRADEGVAVQINSTQNPNARHLVIRGFSDEATSAIVLGSIGSGLIAAFLNLLAAPLRWLTTRSWGIAALVLLAGLSPALIWLNRAWVFRTIPVWDVVAALLVLSVLPIVVGGLFASIFGRELFFEILNLILTVDSVPDSGGAIDVVTLSTSQTSTRGLRHGIYGHPMCPRLVAHWIATGTTKVPLPELPRQGRNCG